MSGPLLISNIPNMKKVVILFLLTLGSLSGQAQTDSTPVVQLIYDYVNIGLGERRRVDLYFRNQESVSIFSNRDSINTGESNEFSASGEDAVGRQVYKNSQTGEITFRDFISEDGQFSPCIVADPMKPMVWTHSSETRTIGKYHCRSAATTFRGRKYVAWYTEEIPVSHGPWKFMGLPGAMVEVHSLDRNLVFTLIRVSTTSTQIKKPSGGKIVSMAYFATRREKSLDDFVNSLQAKLPRGAQITATSSGDYNLETDFSDVERK